MLTKYSNPGLVTQNLRPFFTPFKDMEIFWMLYISQKFSVTFEIKGIDSERGFKLF